MHSDNDYILDLSIAPADESIVGNRKSKIENRKSLYLSIYFKCCRVYAPIYRNRGGTAYAGHCPRCHGRIAVPIGPGGSSARIFQAE